MDPFVLLGMAVAAALAALAFVEIRKVRVVLHTLSTDEPRDTPSKANHDALWDSLEGLEKRTLASIADLTKAVAEGIDHVDRNEKRVRGIITGARRRFEAEGYSDPGVEAEADTLPELHAESGGDQPVLPLPNDVEESGSPWDAVPGMAP